MAKSYETTLTWTEISADSLSDDQCRKYQEYKDFYAVMKTAREAFEQAMQAGVPEGKRIVCGYRFGKLSIALAEDDRPAKRAAAPKQSLADFLAQASATGRRA